MTVEFGEAAIKSYFRGPNTVIESSLNKKHYYIECWRDEGWFRKIGCVCYSVREAKSEIEYITKVLKLPEMKWRVLEHSALTQIKFHEVE